MGANRGGAEINPVTASVRGVHGRRSSDPRRAGRRPVRRSGRDASADAHIPPSSSSRVTIMMCLQILKTVGIAALAYVTWQ
jgi:hypothetical protein